MFYKLGLDIVIIGLVYFEERVLETFAVIQFVDLALSIIVKFQVDLLGFLQIDKVSS